MNPKHNTPKRGSERWDALVAFLTNTMQTAKGPRVRMTAALRLHDILMLRERADQLELKRELWRLHREEQAAIASAKEGNDAALEERAAKATEDADAFLARIAGLADDAYPEDIGETIEQ